MKRDVLGIVTVVVAIGTLLVEIMTSSGATASRWLLFGPAAAVMLLVTWLVLPSVRRGVVERRKQRKLEQRLAALWPHFEAKVEKFAELFDSRVSYSANAVVLAMRVEQEDVQVLGEKDVRLVRWQEREAKRQAASNGVNFLNELAQDVLLHVREPQNTLEGARRVVRLFETTVGGFYELSLRSLFSDLSGSIADTKVYSAFWSEWNEFRKNYLVWAEMANTELGRKKEPIFGTNQRLTVRTHG